MARGCRVGAGLLARRAGGIGSRKAARGSGVGVAHGRRGHGTARDVVGVLHRVDHLLLATLLVEPGHAIGIDALLGEVVCAAAGNAEGSPAQPVEGC